jgi:hypothetical protein
MCYGSGEGEGYFMVYQVFCTLVWSLVCNFCPPLFAPCGHYQHAPWLVGNLEDCLLSITMLIGERKVTGVLLF